MRPILRGQNQTDEIIGCAFARALRNGGKASGQVPIEKEGQ